MNRFAVRVGDQWLGRNRGHDYRHNRPGHDVTDQRHANLWIMKAHASRAANAYDGEVVSVDLAFNT